jgi:NitT/TauT family transport system ATP-binding protein
LTATTSSQTVVVQPPGRSLVDIAVKGLRKEFETRSGQILALEDVTLSVGKGEFVSLIGASGCGKSTLLKMILGVVPISRGTIEVAGELVNGPRADVGMVFQTPALPPWRTILNNVLLPIETLSLPVADYVGRAKDLLKFAGLGDFENKYPKELSGGMQQRVSICRALIHDPRILLMDEPFGALDAMTREVMQGEIRRIWRQTGKTILLVTHSIDEAVVLSDRVICMSPRPGRVISEIKVDFSRTENSNGIQATPRYNQITNELRIHLGLPTR